MLVFIDYNYLHVGGAQQLEISLICELNRRGEKVKVYCSPKSFLYNRLMSVNADFIHINSDIVSHHDLRFGIKDDDIVCITELTRALVLFFNRDCIKKLFFYSIHPDTFFRATPWVEKLPYYKRYLFKLINLLFDKNAIYFMDGPNVRGLERRGFNLSHRKICYIPVPVMLESGLKRKEFSIQEDCRITYVGRGWEEWKIYPVIKLLEDINKIKRKCSLTIITDTNEMFEAMIKRYIPKNNVKVNYIYGLSGIDLEKYLYCNSDVHFSMGISALEGAKLGIPTILLDASHHKFPQAYKYHWLFEAKDYSLADFIDDYTVFGGMVIDEIFKSLYDYNLYNHYSKKCYNYVMKYHSQKIAVDQLLCAAESTTLSANDFCHTMFMVRTLWVSVIEKLKYEAKKIKKKYDSVQ